MKISNTLIFSIFLSLLPFQIAMATDDNTTSSVNAENSRVKQSATDY